MMSTRTRLATSVVTDFVYVDSGCEAAPKCLACHLPRCRFDAIMRKPPTLTEDSPRNRKVLAMRAEGFTSQAIADEVGISAQTVRRILAAARDAAA